MAQVDITVIFQIVGGLIGLIFSGLAGIFFLGIFTQRARASGVIVGVFTGITVTVYLASFQIVHLSMAPFIGLCANILVGYLVSLFITTTPVDLRGLTVYTIKKTE